MLNVYRFDEDTDVSYWFAASTQEEAIRLFCEFNDTASLEDHRLENDLESVVVSPEYEEGRVVIRDDETGYVREVTFEEVAETSGKGFLCVKGVD